MDKVLFWACLFFFIMAVTAASTFAADIGLIINGKECSFENCDAPLLDNGSIIVPVRATYEALGAEVHWDKENKSIVGVFDDLEVKIQLNNSESVPTKIIEGRAYVPLRFVFESLEGNVQWDSENKKAIITTKQELSEEELKKLVQAIASQELREKKEENNFVFYEKGVASWYGGEFHGKATASGEIFDQNEFTAAHRKLPFGTKVKVTFLKTGKSTMVSINDFGPHTRERIIDLSKAAAEAIGLKSYGTGKVTLDLVK